MNKNTESIGVITRDAAGNYYCDGVACICSLGAHEGIARAMAAGNVLRRLSEADRAQFVARFDDDEAAAFEWGREQIRLRGA